MNGKKAKSLRKLAYVIANPNSQGLIHPGKVKLYKKDGLDTTKEKDDAWYIRIFLRRYAQDSRNSLYRRFKKLYTRNQLPEYFINLMSKQLTAKNHA
jgi:hypothetical protein